MKKLTSLRKHLLASVPGLANDPDRLRTYIPEGSIAFHRGQHLSCLLYTSPSPRD